MTPATTLSPPACLASPSTGRARAMSSSAVSSAPVTPPMATVMARHWSPWQKGFAAIARRTRSSASAMSYLPVRGVMMRNSSLWRRPTTSYALSVPLRRRATSHSTSSPASRPNSRLTGPSPSTSRIPMPTVMRSRRARASSSSSRRTICARSCTFVTGSKQRRHSSPPSGEAAGRAARTALANATRDRRSSAPTGVQTKSSAPAAAASVTSHLRAAGATTMRYRSRERTSSRRSLQMSSPVMPGRLQSRSATEGPSGRDSRSRARAPSAASTTATSIAARHDTSAARASSAACATRISMRLLSSRIVAPAAGALPRMVVLEAARVNRTLVVIGS